MEEMIGTVFAFSASILARSGRIRTPFPQAPLEKMDILWRAEDILEIWGPGDLVLASSLDPNLYCPSRSGMEP